MYPQEVLVFKSFDSKTSKGTARSKHCFVVFITIASLSHFLHEARKENEEVIDANAACAHSAVHNPLAPPEARRRESVECLLIVVYPEDGLLDSEVAEEVRLPLICTSV